MPLTGYRYIVFLLIVLTLMHLPLSSQASDTILNEPETLLAEAKPLIENFVTAEHWAAVKNLTGAAKAIIIIPSGGQGGLILGFQSGDGMLFVRNGYDWSDPVFIELTAAQIGLLIGGQSFGAAGAILSEAALQKILVGSTSVGASGDLTIGAGVSGRAAGGASGGIELLMVSSNKGLFFGGSIEVVSISIDDDLNRLAYGDNISVETIINRNSQYSPAESIRALLKRSAYEAVWGSDTN